MNALAFDYSIRLPLAARPASPDWLGSKFLATLDALTEIDANIFPDWEVGDLPCTQAFRSNTVKVPSQTGRGYSLERAPMIPTEPTFPVSIFHIAWMAYLSTPLASDLILPPEIQTERLPDGGLLMIATEERLDPTNPEHVRRARTLAETLIERTGYQRTARHGREGPRQPSGS
jgi:hypothetical protein